jgi:hypothetical protein
MSHGTYVGGGAYPPLLLLTSVANVVRVLTGKLVGTASVNVKVEETVSDSDIDVS